MNQTVRNRDFLPELQFSASRSGGAGGQNVNKVNTKVELRFGIETSNLLTNEEKMLLLSKLTSKLTQDGVLIIVSQTERTQLRNKEQCIARFYNLIEGALKVPKRRKPTNPTAASKERRLEDKKKTSEIKKRRSNDGFW